MAYKCHRSEVNPNFFHGILVFERVGAVLVVFFLHHMLKFPRKPTSYKGEET